MECENKENIVDLMGVCRLCLGTESLISVFDDRITIQQNMVDIIQITSGVIITKNDNVSHKLCKKCISITIKMFKFRSSALVNDNELKTLANVKLKVRLSSSVEKLLKKFPKIKLPSSVSQFDISPVVAINENEITNWFEQLKKKSRTEKNRRKEAKETRDLSEVSSTSENYGIPNESSSSIELSQNLSVESSESISSTSLLLISRESPIPPDVHEIDKDQHRLLQETPVSNMKPSLLSNSSSPCKRTSSVELDSPQSKKIKTNSNISDEDSIDSLVTKKYINKSLSICDICNGILNNAKDLKKHKMSHMRCSLCKKTFKTMEETNKHKENGCSVKRLMNNLPCLKLKRCDVIGESSKECPKASDIQSDKITLVVAKLDLPTEPEIQNEELVKETSKIEPVLLKPNVDTNEILLISDDEDEVIELVVEEDTFVTISNDEHNSAKNSCDKTEVPNYTYKKTISTSNEIKLHINASECQDKTAELSSSSSVEPPLIDISGANSDVDMADCVISENGQHQAVMEMKTSVNVPTEDNACSNSSCNNKAQDSISKQTTDTMNKTSLNISNKKYKNVETAAMRSTTSIITPNIEITGTNIIDVDFAANDTVLLKNLLRKVKMSTKEACIQTVLPCNADITPTFKKDKLFELSNLRDYLNFYKIPINVSYAANYSVRFSSDSSPISKHRTWSKVNTRVSKNVTPPNLPTSTPNTPTVSSKIIGSTTQIATSSAERIPAGRVTNLERGNARTESSILGVMTQKTQSVPNLINKDTETSVAPVTISESAPMTIHSTERIPPLVPLVKKGNVSNESATSTGVIMNTQINLNNQSVSSTVSNPVHMNIGPKQPTLNLNPPILLNYCLPNVNSYNMTNNFVLAQPSSSQRLPTGAATADNAKGISNNMTNNYALAQPSSSQRLPTSAATTGNAKGTSNNIPNNYLLAQPSFSQRLPTSAGTIDNAKGTSNNMPNNYFLVQPSLSQRLVTKAAPTDNAKGTSNNMTNNYVLAQPSSSQRLPTSAATTGNPKGTSNNIPNNYLLAQPSFSQRLPTSAATTDNAKGTFNNMTNNYVLAQSSSSQRLSTSAATTDNAKGTSYNMPNNYVSAQPSSSQRLSTSAATTDNAKGTSNNMTNNYVLAQPSSSQRLSTSAATTDNAKGTSNNMTNNYVLAQPSSSQRLPTSAATTDNAKGTSNNMTNNYVLAQPSSSQRLSTSAATTENAKGTSNNMTNNYVLAQPSSSQRLPTSAATTDNAKGTSNNMTNNYVLAQPSSSQRLSTSAATTDNAKGTSNNMTNNYVLAQPSSSQRLSTSAATTDNAKGTSNNMTNNYVLAQPSSSQRLPTSAATTDNAKRTFTYVPSTGRKYNHYATYSAGPSRLPNASSLTNANMSSAPSKINIVRASNGTTTITPTHRVDVAGNMTPSTKLNGFTAPSKTGCPPNKNMVTVPDRKPSDTGVNINFHNDMPSLNRIDTPNVTNVTNNMPPPTSSFIPHRIPKTIPITTHQIPVPANTDPVNQNLTTHSNCSSNFIQTIRVRNMSELR